MRDLATRECEQLMCQAGSPFGGESDLPEVDTHRPPRIAFGASDRSFDLFADEGGVVENDGEQIVEVVGNTAGELPETLEPARLIEQPL